MSHQFCAELSRQQGDPLAGTGTHLSNNLLISWPRSKWTRKARQARDMPEALTQTLDAIAADGRRVNLIHHHEQPADVHQVFLMPERRRFQVPREALARFLDAWQSQLSLSEWEQGPVRHDLVLCCTHGKKDKCCAKYGYQTYKQLAETVDSHDLPFEVWESSHLGGCRFAASIILLSPVRKYGRIDPEQALPFLQSEAQGRRFLPCYRGDSGMTPVQQSAQVSVLSFLAPRHAAPDLTLVEESGDDQHRRLLWQWQQAGEHGHVQVECEATTIRRVDMCSDLDEGPTESQIWRTTDISTVDNSEGLKGRAPTLVK